MKHRFTMSGKCTSLPPIVSITRSVSDGISPICSLMTSPVVLLL